MLVESYWRSCYSVEARGPHRQMDLSVTPVLEDPHRRHTAGALELLRMLDPTRPVDHAVHTPLLE